jgi:hypothetical protein
MFEGAWKVVHYQIPKDLVLLETLRYLLMGAGVGMGREVLGICSSFVHKKVH